MFSKQGSWVKVLEIDLKVGYKKLYALSNTHDISVINFANRLSS